MQSVAEPVSSSQDVPPINDHEEYVTRQRARGLGSLIGRSSPRQPESPKRHEKVKAKALCRNRINDELCWTSTASERFQATIQSQVEGLLQSQKDKLNKRDRRVLDTYGELFLVGKTIETARKAYILSCNSTSDYERLQKVLKKFPTVPGFAEIELIPMYGAPRSMAPIIPLVLLGSTGDKALPVTENLQVGTSAYGILGQQGALTVPAVIWIGKSPEESYRTVLGGILSVGRSRTQMGLTVSHIPQSTADDSLPAPVGVRSVIGTIASTSGSETGSDLDWALVQFDAGLRLSTHIEPPEWTAKTIKETTTVDLFTPRATVRGSLSPSITYVSLTNQERASKTHAIILDASIRSGDSGAWVVGKDGGLYGHIAFGHPGDNVAYLIPSYDIFKDIIDKNPQYSMVSIAGLGKKSKRSIIAAAERPQADSFKPRTSMEYREYRHSVKGPEDSTKDKSRWLGRGSRLTRSAHKHKYQQDLAFAGMCVANIVYLTFNVIAYFFFAAWATNGRSRLADEGRKRHGTSILDCVNELSEQTETILASLESAIPTPSGSRRRQRPVILSKSYKQDTTSTNGQEHEAVIDGTSKSAKKPAGSSAKVTGDENEPLTGGAKAERSGRRSWSRIFKKGFGKGGAKADARSNASVSNVASQNATASGELETHVETRPLYDYADADEDDSVVIDSDSDIISLDAKSLAKNGRAALAGMASTRLVNLVARPRERRNRRRDRSRSRNRDRSRSRSRDRRRSRSRNRYDDNYYRRESVSRSRVKSRMRRQTTRSSSRDDSANRAFSVHNFPPPSPRRRRPSYVGQYSANYGNAYFSGRYYDGERSGGPELDGRAPPPQPAPAEPNPYDDSAFIVEEYTSSTPPKSVKDA